jgi:hypothetical protein
VPGLFSTTTGTFSRFVRGSLKYLAVASIEVAAEAGTTIWIGLEGYCCAYDAFPSPISGIAPASLSIDLLFIDMWLSPA